MKNQHITRILLLSLLMMPYNATAAAKAKTVAHRRGAKGLVLFIAPTMQQPKIVSTLSASAAASTSTPASAMPATPALSPVASSSSSSSSPVSVASPTVLSSASSSSSAPTPALSTSISSPSPVIAMSSSSESPSYPSSFSSTPPSASAATPATPAVTAPRPSWSWDENPVRGGHPAAPGTISGCEHAAYARGESTFALVAEGNNAKDLATSFERKMAQLALKQKMAELQRLKKSVLSSKNQHEKYFAQQKIATDRLRERLRSHAIRCEAQLARHASTLERKINNNKHEVKVGNSNTEILFEQINTIRSQLLLRPLDPAHLQDIVVVETPAATVKATAPSEAKKPATSSSSSSSSSPAAAAPAPRTGILGIGLLGF